MAGSKARSRPRSGTAAPARNSAAQGKRTGGRQQAADLEPAAPAAQAGPPAWLRWATLVLALAGLAVSIYLTYAHFTESSLAGCSEKAGLVNCGKVTTSPQSMVFGIPVAVLGLAFYVFLVPIMSPWAWRSGRREIALARMLSLVVGIGFVLYLIYAELFDIGSICLYCTSVHVITFILFVLAAISAAIWGLAPGAATTAASRAARRR